MKLIGLPAWLVPVPWLGAGGGNFLDFMLHPGVFMLCGRNRREGAYINGYNVLGDEETNYQWTKKKEK